jgi:hypothetical protein
MSSTISGKINIYFLFNLPIDKMCGVWYNKNSALTDGHRAAEKEKK